MSRVAVALLAVILLFSGCAATGSQAPAKQRDPPPVDAQTSTTSGQVTTAASTTGAPSGTTSPPSTAPQEQAVPEVAVDRGRAQDDVVVIAVVDSGFDPYHWDFLAQKMPQQANADPLDDLPLDTDPASWVPGFPSPASFASYSALDLTLTPDDAQAVPSDLHDADAAQWDKVQTSSPSNIHFRHIPGSKVIGYVNFGSGDGFAAASHGVGTTSVSVGNIHGTCPSCLLVFVNGLGEEASEWVDKQDWIDLQTNSWGFSTLLRDRMYTGSNTALQREASERGQTIFFSAGNGQDGSFLVPNPTLFSSQEGPDWIVTVGAITPGTGSSYSGHGRPADVASVGGSYKSAGGATVTDHSEFGGTSNATPVTAGLYGEALYGIRRELAGASRLQRDGVVAQGPAGCLGANLDCALADGTMTVKEMQRALFMAAEPTAEGLSLVGLGLPGTQGAELTYLSEGHGSFWGLHKGTAQYQTEVDRITGYALGSWMEEEPAETTAWFVADSYCRQSGWGEWSLGYYVDGVTLPPPDPAWPARTWLVEACPAILSTWA